MRDYVLTLLVTAAVTYLLTPAVRRLAVRVGALHEARDRDVHVVPIPRLGGLAMYGGLAAGLLVAEHIPQLRAGISGTGMINGLLLAGGLLVAIGIVDDRWGMSALPKLAGQIAAGAILVATGTQLSWLPEPGGGTFVPTTDQATLITILVVVATINAVNFIDGLDGLAAGIVAIAAMSFFVYYYLLTKVVHLDALAAPALASAVLIGMCLGFLPHNFSPARIFMGDTGSMLLGLLLAYAPISSITWTDPADLAQHVNRFPEIMPLLLPAALLVIPYTDLLLAVVRRTKAGQSPFAADRKHLHHRLLDIGHSQRATVLIMYLWAASFSGSVVWLSIEKTVRPQGANHHGVPVYVLVAITVVALAVLLLISLPRGRWWDGRRARRTAAEAAGQAAGPVGAASDAPKAATPAAGLVAVAAARPPLPAPVQPAAPADSGNPDPGNPGPGDPGAGNRSPDGAEPSLTGQAPERPAGRADRLDHAAGQPEPPDRSSAGRPDPSRPSAAQVAAGTRSVVGTVPPVGSTWVASSFPSPEAERLAQDDDRTRPPAPARLPGADGDRG